MSPLSSRTVVFSFFSLIVTAFGWFGPFAPRVRQDRPSVIVKLEQQNVPVEIGGRLVAHKTAYFGKVHVGYPTPQSFSVVYDTGSAHFFVPSTACSDEACLVHQRFNRSLSSTALNLNHDGTAAPVSQDEHDRVSITYGTGEIVGDFIRDVVCLGHPANGDNFQVNKHCVRARVITATEMSSQPFKDFAFDGVIGLGLESLALKPDYNLFHMMSKDGGMDPVFGFFLSTTAGVSSEIAFGGHDVGRTREAIRWVPVHEHELGYWQVKVHGFIVGGERFDACDGGACQAIVDTGTSLLGVPKDMSQKVHLMLARRVPDTMSNVNCQDYPGPSIVFDMGDFHIEVGPEDHSQSVPITLSQRAGDHPANSTVCRSTMFPIDLPDLGKHVFLFGQPVLRKYYTAYDMENKRVGFALAAQPAASTTNEDLLV